jgi:putative redox protein
MNITLQHIDGFHFTGTGPSGHTVLIDGSAASESRGTSPMQMLVMALGGCSGIDVVSILEKARQPIDDLKIKVQAKQVRGPSHSWFETINVHFILTGDLDEKKVRRAVDLSLNKYCSVAKTLEKTTRITSSFSINGIAYDSD